MSQQTNKLDALNKLVVTPIDPVPPLNGGFLSPEVADWTRRNHSLITQVVEALPDLIDAANILSDYAPDLEVCDRLAGLPHEGVNDTKFCIGRIYERNGERQYTHYVRFETTNQSPDAVLDAIAKTFLGDGEESGEKDDFNPGYLFDGGSYYIEPVEVKLVPKSEYDRSYFAQGIDLADLPEHELKAVTQKPKNR